MLTPEREQRIKLLGTGYEKELLAELDRVREENVELKKCPNEAWECAKEIRTLTKERDQLNAELDRQKKCIHDYPVKEIEQLKAERDEIPTRWDKFYAHEMSEAKKLHDEIKQLREKLAIAVGALTFYSIRKNYDCPCGNKRTCQCGGIARESLAKIRADKPVDEWTQTLREDAQNS